MVRAEVVCVMAIASGRISERALRAPPGSGGLLGFAQAYGAALPLGDEAQRRPRAGRVREVPH